MALSFTDAGSSTTACSNEVWYTWTTTTAMTVSADATWVRWAVDTGTTDSSTVWVTWTQNAGQSYVVGQPQVDARTPEQKAADEARWAAERAMTQRLAAEAEQKRIAARDRARALLLSMLSKQQRDQLERERFFEVVAQSQKRYRIRQGTHGNVRLIDGGRESVSYCAQPLGVPDEDAMLAQKLMIETDEAAFLRVANATRM